MAFTGEQLEVTDQLNRARATLGEALGQTQDITNSGLDVDHISASLAGSVKEIFFVQNTGIRDPACQDAILRAMDHLRNTLELLQEVPGERQSLEKITSTTARILALLYPISKVLDEVAAARQPSDKPESPIVLTSAAPKTDSPPSEAAPIPLVSSAQDQAAKPTVDDALARVAKPMSSVPPDGMERRNNDRRQIDVDIGIHSNTNFFTGFSHDISTGGIFIATYDILSIGQPLNVNFTVPGGPVLSVDGIVRWVREYNEVNPEVEPGMGVQFENLASQDKLSIHQYMEQNPPIFYDDE